MKILCLDCETTGLEADKDKITELGLVLYESDNNRVLMAKSWLISDSGPVSEEITKLTGITNENLCYGVPADTAEYHLDRALTQCDYVVAHNAPFDMAFISALYQQINERKMPDVPVIDTRTDLPLTYKPKSHALRSLIVDHEFLNYFPHSALGDALVMMKLLQKYDLEAVIALSKIPSVKIRALVSFEDKDKAKARGYHWDGVAKIWYTTMKKNAYNPDDFDFKTKIIEG